MKKSKRILAAIVGCCVIVFGLSAKAQKQVKVGKQVWMATNLNVERFRNGDIIPQAKTNQEWNEAGSKKQPAWCYFNNDPKNGEAYGKLYNWYAVNDPRGLAPKGWHIPSDAEWNTLVEFLGGKENAAEKLKSNSGWAENGNGTNSSGLSCFPGGYRNYSGECEYVERSGYWWTTTEESVFNAWEYCFGYQTGDVNRYSDGKSSGFSVRCVRN
jgi:uncharacterized protein (TIGR02145 family)